MQKVIHKSESRGYADHGWLEARHSFSFANWYNPERVQFGALRVINDDKVAPGRGFSTHPHDNMEIITIPTQGGVRHQDNMGNEGVVMPGELQIMSAGTGVTHSELNASQDESLKLFQIWIFPDMQNVEPRYQQIKIKDHIHLNKINLLVGPKNGPSEAWINQNAFISLFESDKEQTISYQLYEKTNGVYIFVVEGSIIIDDEELLQRDAIGLWETEQVELSAKSDTKVLFFEVPMNY